VLGSPDDRSLATDIANAGGAAVRDLTGEDLRDAILALAATDVRWQTIPACSTWRLRSLRLRWVFSVRAARI